MDYSYTPQTNHTYAPPTGNKNASYYRACARRVLAGSWVNASLGNFLGMAIQEGAMLLAMLPGFVMVILGMLFAEGEYKGPMVLAIFGFALIYILMFAAVFLVGGPLTVGLSKMHLDLLDRKEFSLGGIFRPFKECFGRSVRLYARYTLVLVGIALLGVAAMMIGIFGVTVILVLLAPAIAPFMMIFLTIILYGVCFALCYGLLPFRRPSGAFRQGGYARFCGNDEGKKMELLLPADELYRMVSSDDPGIHDHLRDRLHDPAVSSCCLYDDGERGLL